MKQAFLFIVTLIALILHLSFFSISPLLRFNLHLPLLVLVTWSLIDQPSRSVWGALIAGLILDITSEASFGTIMIALVSAVIGARLLYQGVVSNRSFAGYLLLILSATMIYWIVFWGEVSLLYWLKVDDLYWGMLPHPLWQNIFITLIIHTIVAFFSYQIFGRILKSFRRHFLPLTKTSI